MRFLVGENVNRALTERLRTLGHDVATIAAGDMGKADPFVLANSNEAGRVLSTFDLDFGELVVVGGLPALGVILIRLRSRDLMANVDVLASSIHTRDDWEGHFSVVTKRSVRMRPLRNQ